MISAILLNYNQKKFIKEQFLSIMRQDYKGEWELIIADDASTDGSYELLQELVSGAGENRRIVLHRNEENKGIAGNLQSAVNLSSGEWIVKFDGDDIARDDHISTLLSLQEKHPGNLIYSTLTNGIDEDGNATSNHPDSNKEVVKPYKKRISDISQIPYNWGCVSMYHRSLFSDFEALPIGKGIVDDTILGFRAYLKRSGMVSSGKRTIFYRMGSNNIYNIKNNSSQDLWFRRTNVSIKTHIFALKDVLDKYKAGEISYLECSRLFKLINGENIRMLLFPHAEFGSDFSAKFAWYISVLQCRPRLWFVSIPRLFPRSLLNIYLKYKDKVKHLLYRRKKTK